MQQAGDDFAYRAQFVGQRLVRAVQPGAVTEQGGGQTGVEPLKRHRFDQGGQIGHALGKQAEHESAKHRIGQRGLEIGWRQQHQAGGATGHAARTQRLGGKQARR